MKPTYSELLRDPRWQKMRLKVMERDGFRCRACGDETRTLAVHHLTYQKGAMPWDYPQPALITLCDPCHKHCEEMKECVNWFVASVPPHISQSVFASLENAIAPLSHDRMNAEDILCRAFKDRYFEDLTALLANPT
jgi:hypothetical protein